MNTLQWTVGNAPEGLQLIAAIGLLANRFGLSQTQAVDLRNGFGESYKAMNSDPQCAGLTSALDEIFASDPERQGHYFVYVPTEPSVAAPTILFLHGYGGNLKYYIWALKEAFPDSVIVAPTWGIGWHDGDVVYVDEVCRNVETHFRISLGNKWVMGLSAGGPAGFRVMNRKPSDYEGYICIASGLPQQRAAELSFTEPILMLNGINDVRFPIQFVRRGIAEMESHGLCVEQVELDRDHFFLLTQRVETFQIIESFIQKHSTVPVNLSSIDKPHWMLRLLRSWGLFFLGLSILYLVAIKKLRGRRKKLS
ncbi:alpha/beta hydrolase [Novipirellula sp. SH528]|uniref:alpha/beta hydrolase n=1 Tax=Novipirellula sp. SH528 TaxID=3454466 RepID=UPI003F9F3D31